MTARVLAALLLSATVSPPADAQERIAGRPATATRRAIVRFDDLAARAATGAGARAARRSAPRPMPIPAALPVDAAPSRGVEARAAEALPFPPSFITSPPTTSSFLALVDDGSTVPPDTEGAVGPNHLMVALNSGVRIQNRSGSVISTVSLATFWSAVYGGSNVFDPHVVFEPYNGRWITVAAADEGGSSSQFLLGVSQTDDPTGAWNLAAYDVDAANLVWADYPQLGFNKDWIVVQLNMFSTADDSFVRSDVFVIDKLDAYAGGSNPATHLVLSGQGGTQVPALTYDNTLAEEYLLTNFNGNSGGNGFIRLYTLNGPLGAETLSLGPFISVAAPWDFGPPAFADFAPQLGSLQKIQNGDARMLGLVYRNGTLWATQNVFLPAGGAPTRTAAQWWQLTPTGLVLQRGRVDDPTNTIFYAYPSIAVNKDDGVLLGYSTFSATQYASASYSFRAADDPPNTMEDDVLLKAGEASYYKTFSGPDNRWGDFSATVVDPVNDTDLWTIQEYAASPSDTWSTWWGQVVPPPTPTPTPTATSTALTPTPTPTATITPSMGVKLYGIQNQTVYEINPDAMTVTPLSPTLPFVSPLIATIDPSAIYVIETPVFPNLDYVLNRYRPGVGVTPIGTSIGVVGMGEGRDGFLWGVESSGLFQIDPIDPEGEFIGVQQGVAPYAGDVAADPATGILYASRNDGILVIVDKQNGAQTPIGIPSTAFWGLAFSRDGRLWGTQGPSGDLYQIDPMTGAATFVMPTVSGMADLASQLACGDGVIDPGEDCDDGNLTNGDGCSEDCAAEPCFTCTGTPSACTQLPDDIACDPGTLCKINNRCSAGVCVGDAIPVPGCRVPVAPRKAALLIKDKTPNKKDRLVWKWVKGQATAIGDFGTPGTTTDYELCIYNNAPSLVARFRVPAGGTCAGRPCWLTSVKKDKYNDKDLTPDGVQKLQLKPGAVNGKAKALLKGKGGHLPLPNLPITNLPVTVQLKSGTGECWSAVYSTPKKNQFDQFKAKAD